MTKNRFIAISFCIILIGAVVISSLPTSFADHDIKKKTVEVTAKNPHEVTIEVGKGKIEYNWTINPVELRSYVLFTIEGEDNLKEVYSNISSKKDDIDGKEGEYTFTWANTNGNVSFNITYKITYQEPPGEGCYSSSIVLSILIMALVICTFGYYSNKRKRNL